MPDRTKKSLKSTNHEPARARPRFRFGKRIGGGGMGEVRAAQRVDAHGNVLDDKLAVKSMDVTFLTSPEAVKRFKREVKTQRKLDHPNIMPIVGQNLEASPPWFAMPLADGNLHDEIPSDGMGVPQAADAVRQILAGLAHAHDHDVVHRDIKPLNVLRVGNALKLSDFGLVKSLAPDATDLTRTHQRMGTEPFMAPEQWDTPKAVGKPADVYAVGKLLCMLSTGKQPPIRAYDLGGVAQEFHYFVIRCCDPDPAGRYPDAGAALKAFDAFMRTDGDPEETAKVLAQGAAEALDGIDRDDADAALAALAAHLVHHADDGDMYRAIIPRLAHNVVRALLDADTTAFATVLRSYDEHIDVSLDFDYCDLVARFYRLVWRTTDDLKTREIILARLIDLGATHHRYLVRDVVAELLSGIKDKATEMMAVSVIGSDPSHAAWHAEEALKQKLPRSVARALRDTMS
jgi:hypothetical protein